MAQQHLDITAAPTGGIGSTESLNAALQKIEDNFGELYSTAQAGLVGAVSVAGQSEDLVLNDSSGSARETNATRIQSAIDYAYNNGRQVTNLGAGVIHTNQFYLDAPGNLRADPANPSIFSFSMHLKGAGGIYNHNNHGTQLRVADNTQPAVIVGTGQGMRVSGLSVIGPVGASSRAALPAEGVGIAMAGGPAGASRILLDGVGVANFRQGYVTGYNADQLCDSVTLMKCVATGCYRGINFSKTQNYINNMIACDFGDNTTHVYSAVSKAVNVIGGNYSATDAKRNAFIIANVSVLTQFSDSIPGSGFSNYSCVVTLDDDDQPMRDGAYDAFCVVTEHFGIVALNLIDYDPDTKEATLKLDPWWLTSHFDPSNFVTNTDIEAEIQAATLLYACETVTPFQGACINVSGVHIENPGVLTRLFYESVGFGGDSISHFDRITFNHNIDQHEYASSSEAFKAVFYCQQVFPFIRFADAGGQSLMLANTAAQNTTDRIVIDSRSGIERLVVKNCGLLPNIRSAFGVPGFVGFDQIVSQTAYGAGEWDSTPFFPASGAHARYYTAHYMGHVPYRGHFPAPHATPYISATTLADIEDGLGDVGSYPALLGDTVYHVKGLPTGPFGSPSPTTTFFAKSGHKFFGYGQDLTVNWSYKGQSNVVYMDDLDHMFAGLWIVLNNGTDGDQGYLVTGIYPTLGYVTVHTPLSGTKTSTYTGDTVKQEPYSITTLSGS